MPNCTKPIAKQKCGEPCTQAGQAYLKDCKTGNIYYGNSYEEVRAKSKKILQVRGSGKAFPGVRKIHPISKIKTIKPIEASGRVVPGATGAGKNKSGEIIVPVGSRFDDKPDNWKDTEKLLGDPEPDDDPSTVGGFDNNCFGIPMNCGYLVIAGLAVVVLIMVLR